MLIEFLSIKNDSMYLVEWLFIAFGLYLKCVYICCNYGAINTKKQRWVECCLQFIRIVFGGSLKII